MSTTNGTNDNIIVILTSTAILYSAHHVYKFDGGRCMIPNRKEWFRSLLMWMWFLQSAAWLVWGCGWAYIKYKLGWITLPGYGHIAYPSELFTPEYQKFNNPLTFCCVFAYCLQVSLNAEEGLYWYHLMRAVRRPQSANTWFKSSFFFAWIALSLVVFVAIACVAWIQQAADDTQLARIFICGSTIEIIVLAASSIVLVLFPSFLRDVKASGAGPDVRSRLHYYHEANKVRNFFRLIFGSCILILGADGVTTRKVVNLNHIASDVLQQLAVFSFFFTSIASINLYLPRTYGTAAQRGQVMVGRAQERVRHGNDLGATSGHALMTLLREGGWGDAEFEHQLRSMPHPNDLDAGGIRNFGKPKGWSMEGGIGSGGRKQFGSVQEENWESEGRNLGSDLPTVINNFTSPLAVPVFETPMPTEIRIHVEQEVHDDRGNPA